MHKLAICTPVYDGRAHAAHYRGVSDIRAMFARKGVDTAHMDAGHSANLPRLRNALVATALDWGADAILWIDSDIAAGADDAWTLWESGADIIGAAPQKRPQQFGEPGQVAFKPLPGGVVEFDGTVSRVGAVPTAFCLHRRAVYAALREADIAKQLMNADGPKSPWFRNFFWYELEPTEGGYTDDGEDYYFCRKAREVGFDSYVHAWIRPIHHEGRMRLPVNFGDVYGDKDR